MRVDSRVRAGRLGSKGPPRRADKERDGGRVDHQTGPVHDVAQNRVLLEENQRVLLAYQVLFFI